MQVEAPKPSVVVLWSGERPGSYLPGYRPTDDEAWLDAIRSTPDMIDGEMERALQAIVDVEPQPRTFRSVVRQACSRIIRFTWEIAGHHPASAHIAFRHRKSGGFINEVRALNNLPRLHFRAKDKDEPTT